MLRLRILLAAGVVAGVVAATAGVVMIVHDRATSGSTAYTPLVTLRLAPVPSTPWPALALLLAGAVVAGASGVALVLLRSGRWGLPR